MTAPDRPQIVTDTTVIPAEDEKDGCPRCSGKVFEAEKMTTKNGFYHKKCKLSSILTPFEFSFQSIFPFKGFTCGNCKRALDYQLCTEGPDANIYCKLCYAHMFGHKAKPNLNVADVTVIPGEEGDSNTCPRYQLNIC